MQTFLPYPEFLRSAEALDVPRLGKQRVETLQMLRALELDDYGWRNHPAVRMWQGHTPALVAYGLAVVQVWTALGHADSTRPLLAEFAPDVEALTQADLAARNLLPGWLGDERLHLSHRSALVRKDPAFYRPVFGDVPDDLPYHWPDADQPAPVSDQAGQPLWIVRARTADVAQAFLGAGFVALAQPGARSAKGRRQLVAFREEVEVGDLVALPLDAGAALALGQIAGPYREEVDDAVLPYRRDVHWLGEVPRSAVRSPARLQDPRALFRVRLGAGALVSEGSAAAPGRTAG